MARIRILSLLTLSIAVLCFHYGYDELSHGAPWGLDKSGFPVALLILAYLLFVVIAALSIVSSIMIFLLSFFALIPDKDGSFVIDLDSWYGRIFLFVSGSKRDSEISYCRAFWSANWMIFCFSFVSAAISAILILFWKVIVQQNAVSQFISGLLWAGAIFGGLIGLILLILYIKEFIWPRFLRNTQFGVIYDKYLCPRLKIK